MKIRLGFVSNSSTANFIIRIKESVFNSEEDAILITNEKDIEKLKEYGFENSYSTSPFDNKDKDENWIAANDDYISMKYFVTCNYEDDVCFLVANNIPFKASCHYGHKYMSYKKDSDYIFEANNFGLALDMYGEDLYDVYDTIDNKEFLPFRKIPKNEFLEENKGWENRDE